MFNVSYIAVPLHEEVRQKVVRIRWWQPHHSGRAHNDWAIDNIFIGGILNAPENFSAINNNFLVGNEWLTATHIDNEEYCDSKMQVAVGKSISNEDAVLETSDIHVKKDYVLEFMVSVHFYKMYIFLFGFNILFTFFIFSYKMSVL